jgi:DNA/RNA-binding domain of Phe-tRNA-synthetase-like protein
MKKKTVITTEKREVWVIREAIPESSEEQTIDLTKMIEVPVSNSELEKPSDGDDEEQR